MRRAYCGKINWSKILQHCGTSESVIHQHIAARNLGMLFPPSGGMRPTIMTAGRFFSLTTTLQNSDKCTTVMMKLLEREALLAFEAKTFVSKSF